MGFWSSRKESLTEFVREYVEDYIEEGAEAEMEVHTMKERETPVEAPPIHRVPPVQRGSGDTVIRKGTTINGTLRGQGSVTVEGTVEGEISFDGSITIAGSGMVKGPVAANILRVSGTIEGDVSAKERLILESTGQIQGDIETVSLVIEDGGRLNGRAAMLARPVSGPQAVQAPQKQKEELELMFGPNYPVGRDGGKGTPFPKESGEDAEETESGDLK